jgi:hypothetical protein
VRAKGERVFSSEIFPTCRVGASCDLCSLASLARLLARPPELCGDYLLSFLFSSAAALVVIVVTKFVIVFLGCGREFH